ncbi:hypothetical protein [Cytobacillus purgationiresistens]|uniref:Permuted papain-like amidase YaeF/Yiix C92 family enzyme n=1 Tax=Cytobacillus purgationiresistens TaxID=863449 RepID=A0ABU0AND2_9BACI|nr:hypothetical protein [Cytobacillus purgationiresistens]MDQ0272302.1 hypothetical protein [Cytobacillus purgationiresistens]
MEKKIYLLLTDTGTWFTKCIKLYTKKTFNHASLALDHQFNHVYSFGRKRPHNPFIGGFVKENIRSPFFHHTKCAIYSCSVSEEQLQQITNYLEIIDTQKHKYRYNLLGLFAIIFNKNLERPHAFFCSQFVATLLEKGKITGLTKPASLITPHDLIQLPQLEVIYEGKLSNYIHSLDEGRKGTSHLKLAL